MNSCYGSGILNTYVRGERTCYYFGSPLSHVVRRRIHPRLKRGFKSPGGPRYRKVPLSGVTRVS